MTRTRQPLLGLLLGCALACTETSSPTQVIVLISGERQVRDEASAVDVVVESYASAEAGGSRAVFEHAHDSVPDLERPLKVVLEPKAGDATRLYRVTARARGLDGAVVATARLLGGFIGGSQRYVRLVLEDECIVPQTCSGDGCAALECSEDSTCHAGECVPAEVDPSAFGAAPATAPSAGELASAGSMDGPDGMDGGTSGSGGGRAGAGAGAGRGAGGTTANAGASAAGASAAGANAAGEGGVMMEGGALTDGPGTDTSLPEPPEPQDPGQGPWEEVAPDDVGSACRLDRDLLAAADTAIGAPYAIFRYGKLCHTAGADSPTSVYLGHSMLGILTGHAAYETRAIARTGPSTGPLLDTDRASHWLPSQSYNANAQIAHVLAMTAHSANLAYGSRTFSYDTIGSAQVNTLVAVVNTAIAQDAARLGSGTGPLAQRLFDALGMTDTSWNGATVSAPFTTTLRDMGRLGTLLVHGGVFGGQRLLDARWVYRTTHAAFEDTNTAFAYLMWVNHRGSAVGIGGITPTPTDGDPCTPAAIWTTYPHAPSEAPDCNPESGRDCAQLHDVGVWSAEGLNGHFIVGHPGLDLVIVAKTFSGGGGRAGLWQRIRPAVVALDPVYPGDEAAFCAAYGANTHAPDLRVVPTP